MFTLITKIPFEGKEVPLYQTDEYYRFKFIEENRGPELRSEEGTNHHSKQIEQSIQNYGYLITFVVVNEKWQLIDGQHRLAALRELGLPVYALVMKGYNGREIQALNTANKNWSKFDFANYWAMKGEKHYINLLALCDELPQFGVGTMATLLSDQTARQPDVFNEGVWKITKDLKATRIYLFQLVELSEIIPKLTNRSCAEAYLRVASNPKFSFKRMKESIDSYGVKYHEPGLSKEAYIMMFTEIYNHGRVGKNRVFFYNQKELEIAARTKKKVAAAA